MHYGTVLEGRDIAASRLPTPRGPVTEALFDLLRRDPRRARVSLPQSTETQDDPLLGDDSALALYCAYELFYRGFRDIDPKWEWNPGLLAWRQSMEDAMVIRLRDEVGELPGVPEIPRALNQLVDESSGPSLSAHLLASQDAEQFKEMAVHRSIYQLKEADPHTWAIPRLAGHAKAAAVEIQADEYGAGIARDMHQNLFAVTMSELGLDPAYHAYLGQAPGWTLAASNAVTMFGLHRRWLGAIVGHLAVFEMTSVEPMGANASALRSMGYGPDARHFFAVHVVADAHHQHLAADKLAKGLAQQHPDLARDIVFGGATVMTLESIAAERMLNAWSEGRSSLLQRQSAAA